MEALLGVSKRWGNLSASVIKYRLVPKCINQISGPGSYRNWQVILVDQSVRVQWFNCLIPGSCQASLASLAYINTLTTID